MPLFSKRTASWRRGLVGIVAVAVAAILILNPEFAALGLLDAAFFDTLVLLITFQFFNIGRVVSLNVRIAYVRLRNALRFIGGLLRFAKPRSREPEESVGPAPTRIPRSKLDNTRLP